jgi:hypothetical protein
LGEYTRNGGACQAGRPARSCQAFCVKRKEGTSWPLEL